MPTYLYIHKEHPSGPQERYRGVYPLKHVDYELSRAVGRKGEVISNVQGGKIRIVVDGFADSLLMAWLFDAVRREDGVLVTVDEHEKVLSKLHFDGASVSKFRFNYDSRVKEGTSTILTIAARAIRSDNDLHFESR